jgi:hypothetical protein
MEKCLCLQCLFINVYERTLHGRGIPVFLALALAAVTAPSWIRWWPWLCHQDSEKESFAYEVHTMRTLAQSHISKEQLQFWAMRLVLKETPLWVHLVTPYEILPHAPSTWRRQSIEQFAGTIESSRPPSSWKERHLILRFVREGTLSVCNSAFLLVLVSYLISYFS